MSSEENNIGSRLLKFANKLFCRDCGGQLSIDDFKAVPLTCRDALYNNVHCANCTRLCWICDDPTPATLSSKEKESGKSHTPPPVSSSDSSLSSAAERFLNYASEVADKIHEKYIETPNSRNVSAEGEKKTTYFCHFCLRGFAAQEGEKTQEECKALNEHKKYCCNTQTPQRELAQLKVFYKTVEDELTFVIRKLMKINDKYPDDISLPEAIRELQILRDMCVRYG